MVLVHNSTPAEYDLVRRKDLSEAYKSLTDAIDSLDRVMLPISRPDQAKIVQGWVGELQELQRKIRAMEDGPA